MQTDKTAPLGECDLCGGVIDPDDPGWFTSHGRPRRYCGVDCRNTANSRGGAAIISAKTRQRVERGEWQNPAHLHPPTPEEQGRRHKSHRLGRSQTGGRETRKGNHQCLIIKLC